MNESDVMQGNDGQDAVSWLIDGMENLSLVGKAWAGASHWRFRTQRNPNADPELADAPAKAQSKGSSRSEVHTAELSRLQGLLELTDRCPVCTALPKCEGHYT